MTKKMFIKLLFITENDFKAWSRGAQGRRCCPASPGVTMSLGPGEWAGEEVMCGPKAHCLREAPSRLTLDRAELAGAQSLSPRLTTRPVWNGTVPVFSVLFQTGCLVSLPVSPCLQNTTQGCSATGRSGNLLSCSDVATSGLPRHLAPLPQSGGRVTAPHTLACDSARPKLKGFLPHPIRVQCREAWWHLSSVTSTAMEGPPTAHVRTY